MKLFNISMHTLLLAASTWDTASARAMGSPADKPLQGETDVAQNSSSKSPPRPSR